MEKIFLYDPHNDTKYIIKQDGDMTIEELELFAYEQQAEAMKSNTYLWVIKIKSNLTIN